MYSQRRQKESYTFNIRIVKHPKKSIQTTKYQNTCILVLPGLNTVRPPTPQLKNRASSSFCITRKSQKKNKKKKNNSKQNEQTNNKNPQEHVLAFEKKRNS